MLVFRGIINVDSLNKDTRTFYAPIPSASGFGKMVWVPKHFSQRVFAGLGGNDLLELENGSLL